MKAGAALILAVGVLGLPSNASAANGFGLRVADCFYGSDGRGDDNCKFVPGLRTLRAVAASPDGKYVYTAASDDQAIGTFKLKQNERSLKFVRCIQRKGTGVFPDEPRCGASPGLALLWSIAASPDGRSIYTAGENILAHFHRQAGGRLQFAACFDDPNGLPEYFDRRDCVDTDGLFDTRGLVVSDDGRSIYTISDLDETFTSFSREPSTGRVRFGRCWSGGFAENAPACARLSALRFPGGLTVSPEGNSVYLVGSDLLTFARDTSGGLSYRGSQGFPGLRDFGAAVAVSPDGKSAYTVTGDALTHFKRDRATGVLRQVRCYGKSATFGNPNPCKNTPGVENGSAVAVSPDAGSVYVVGSDSFARFKRKRKKGTLKLAGCLRDDETGPKEKECREQAGLTGGGSVAVSPDSKSVYVTSFNDNTLLHLVRGKGRERG